MTSADATPVPAPLGRVLAVWVIAWSFGGVVLGQVVLALSGTGAGERIGTVTLAALAATSWACFGVGVVWLSRSVGGRVADLIAWRFRPADLLGIPAGIVAQVVAIPVLYLPLRAVWSDTFAPERLEETATDLVDAAVGWRIVLLVLVVVVGAPIVEEVVYRGVLQRAAVARFGGVAGWLGASLFFGLIHLRPVELPGLALAGLVFGVFAWRTGRLGGSVLAHVAFNATGLIPLLV
ncbi:MAG: hypothetical protein RIR49_739 [Actinomycetota bacterium]|jgi:membrane protease YdiL (CAAX protease family)